MEKLILSYFLFLLPTWLEAFVIDPYVFWNRGKDDKPLSTYIRGVLIILSGLMADFVFHYGHWYYGIMISLTFHILAFAFFVNIQLNREPGYLGIGKYDTMIKKIPVEFRLSVSIILFNGSIVLFELTKF